MEDPIEEFVDERQKSWCVHCGAWIDAVASNFDHAPSKALLREPHPANLPVVRVCVACNSGNSLDEEYFATFLGCVLAGSTDPDAQLDSRIARTLRRSPKLRSRIEAAKKAVPAADGLPRLIWEPEWDRVKRVVLKNARGHAFYEYGEPMLDAPQQIWVKPLETLTDDERTALEDLIGAGWSEVGSRMLTRCLSGQDLEGAWVVVQPGVYRYTVGQNGGLTVRTIIAEYLATEVSWGMNVSLQR